MLPNEAADALNTNQETTFPDALGQHVRSLLKKDLVAIAKRLGITNYSNLNKEALVARILEYSPDEVRRAANLGWGNRQLSFFRKHWKAFITIASFAVGVISLVLYLVGGPDPPPPVRDDVSLGRLEELGDFLSLGSRTHGAVSFHSIPNNPADFTRFVEDLRIVGSVSVSFEESRRSLTDLQLRGLSQIPGLQRLNLSSNVHITNIACLGTCANLTHLHLRNTGVIDVSGLRHLPALEHLDLSQTKVTSVVGLSDLPSLTILHLDDTHVENIESLRYAPQLGFLSIKNAPHLHEFSLQQTPELSRLELARIPARRVTIKNLPQLQFLDLVNSEVEELVIDDLPCLRYVQIRKNPNVYQVGIRKDPSIPPAAREDSAEMESVDISENDSIKAISLGNLGALDYLTIQGNLNLSSLTLHGVGLSVSAPSRLEIDGNPELRDAVVSDTCLRDMLRAKGIAVHEVMEPKSQNLEPVRDRP